MNEKHEIVIERVKEVPEMRSRLGLWSAPVALSCLAMFGLVAVAVAETQSLQEEALFEQAVKTPETREQLETQVRALYQLKLREMMTPEGLGVLIGDPSIEQKRADQLLVNASLQAVNLTGAETQSLSVAANDTPAPEVFAASMMAESVTSEDEAVAPFVHNPVVGVVAEPYVTSEPDDDEVPIEDEGEEESLADAHGHEEGSEEVSFDEQELIALEAKTPVMSEIMSTPGASAAPSVTLEDDGQRPVEGNEPAGTSNPQEAWSAVKGTLHMPLLKGRVTNEFGVDKALNSRGKVRHTGWTIRAPSGHRVRSAAAGVVVYSGHLKGYGLTVIADHGDGLHGVYAHLRELHVIPGKRLERGLPIGVIGKTGSLRNEKLYFELRIKGYPVNPQGWFRSPHLETL